MWQTVNRGTDENWVGWTLAIANLNDGIEYYVIKLIEEHPYLVLEKQPEATKSKNRIYGRNEIKLSRSA